MAIITGSLQPDEGKVVWSKKHRVGYMDQHAALGKGKTTREALAEAFWYLFDVEKEINATYMKMAEMMTQKKSNRPSDFIDALITLQKECKVHSIKLSEFGIQSEDFPKFLQNARDTMGGLFTLDPRPITDEEILHIFKNSYK